MNANKHPQIITLIFSLLECIKFLEIFLDIKISLCYGKKGIRHWNKIEKCPWDYTKWSVLWTVHILLKKMYFQTFPTSENAHFHFLQILPHCNRGSIWLHPLTVFFPLKYYNIFLCFWGTLHIIICSVYICFWLL